MTEKSDAIYEKGYQKAIEMLHNCSTDSGFLASPTKNANYRRVWGRDGAIIGMGALMTGDADLIETLRKTLETLAANQGPHGEIPSNVDTRTDRISYGGTAGRIDANLWFVIACGEYWKKTGDDGFLERMLESIEKVRFLLGAWEFNNRGLLYIPLTGDWADEFIHNGYVLYDQLLYLQALRTICAIRCHLHDSADHRLVDRMVRLKHLIRDNYWFERNGNVPENVYHEILYKNGKKAAEARQEDRYWMAFFNPHGYGYRFDSFANILVSLLDVAGDRRRQRVDTYIAEQLFMDQTTLLPAFHPVIKPVDDDWKELQVTYTYKFRNRPHEYHNGGRWPMLSGFYAADLAQRGKTDLARRCLVDIHRANAMEMEGQEWSFPEYIHGQKLTPGGNRMQGWSAAGAIIAHHALEQEPVFRITDRTAAGN